jgi:hypothetical protein
LVFVAPGVATDYTTTNVFVLTQGTGAYPMAVPLTKTGVPPTPGWTRIERSTIYLAGVTQGADPFQWDLLYPADWYGPWPYADWWNAWAEWYGPEWGPEHYGPLSSFDVGTVPAGEVAVKVGLLGWSRHQHTVEAFVNDVSVGTLTFEGATNAVLEGRVPAGVLRPAGNRLSLSYTARSDDPDVAADLPSAYLDYLELNVAPTPETALVPAEAVRLDRYDGSLPSLRGVQYLIVTNPMFREQADRVAALKEAEGLTTRVIETDNIFDRWSGGIFDAAAIRQAIRHAATQSRKLRYVLLVGDDYFDNAGYLGWGGVSYLPSLMAWDGTRNWGYVPSENLYADLDDDGTPELAIGRLPVQTVDEANALVDKIASQDATLAAVAGRHTFSAEAPGSIDIAFDAEANEMANKLDGFERQYAMVGAGIDYARARLFAAWNAGAVTTSYFGHGSPEVWSNSLLLTTDDLAQLAESKPTVVFTWACQAQLYNVIYPAATINESLLLLPTGGALATFGPAGVSAPAAQRPLYAAFYENLSTGEKMSLGEAIRRAKATAIAGNPGSRPAVEGYNLLGDPALILPRYVPPPQ